MVPIDRFAGCRHPAAAAADDCEANKNKINMKGRLVDQPGLHRERPAVPGGCTCGKTLASPTAALRQESSHKVVDSSFVSGGERACVVPRRRE